MSESKSEILQIESALKDFRFALRHGAHSCGLYRGVSQNSAWNVKKTLLLRQQTPLCLPILLAGVLNQLVRFWPRSGTTIRTAQNMVTAQFWGSQEASCGNAAAQIGEKCVVNRRKRSSLKGWAV